MSIFSHKSNAWRDAYNPLRGMSVARMTSLLEAGDRGAYADLQWFNFFMERSDSMIFSVIQRRLAALLACDWDIKRVSAVRGSEFGVRGSDERGSKGAQGAKGTGESTDLVLAQEQAAMLREAYEAVDNLRDAVSFLFSGFFRGFAHLEKNYSRAGIVERLEPVEQWFWVRDGMFGDWEYNRDAVSGRTRGERIERGDFVVVEAVPIVMQ